MNIIQFRRKQFFIIIFTTLFCLFFIFPIINYNVSAQGSINVYSPSNGQVLYHGQTCSILWNSYEAGDTVIIELYRGGYYSTITSSTANDGQYTWTVPQSLPVGGTYYQIKVSNITGTVYDYSGYFSIDSRSITVTSPYSGLNWYQGGTYTISWNSDDAGNYGKIELYKNGLYYSTITSSVYIYNYGSYLWAVPTSIPADSTYQIKITSNSYSNVYDFSSQFSIEERTIIITSPKEDDILYRTETSTITWTSDVYGNVRVDLYKDGSFYSSIITNTYNSGKYDWAIESSTTIDDLYQIKITSLDYSDIYDFSDYFSIDERFIMISSPSAKDIWYKDDTETISWSSKNAGDYVTIEIYGSYPYSYSIIRLNTTNDGKCLWTVPSSISVSSSYRIKIIGMPGGIVNDFSDSFFIYERTITINSPSGGEIWYIGESYPITWRSENIGEQINIDLYENGNYHSSIASDEHDNGYFYWTIPSNLNLTSEYSIKISSSTHEDVYEYSNGYIGIEKPLIQSWLGTILVVITIIIILIIVYVLIKKKIIKLPKLSKSSNSSNKTKETVELKREIKTESITLEKYEEIWEGK